MPAALMAFGPAISDTSTKATEMGPTRKFDVAVDDFRLNWKRLEIQLKRIMNYINGIINN